MNNSLGDNPLYNFNAAIPFAEITAAHVGPAAEAVLLEVEQVVKDIIAADKPTFDNTMLAFDVVFQKLHRCFAVAEHILNVNHSDELQAALDAVKPKRAALLTEVSTNSDLYQAFVTVKNSEEFGELEKSAQAALEKQIEDMERAGAGLEPDKKATLVALEGELATLTSSFMQNMLKSTNAHELIITDESRLEGLPESALQAARKSAESVDKEGYRFTLQAPSVIPVIRYATDASLRQEISTAFSRRATGGEFDNTEIVKQILAVRQQKAELLGRKNIGEHILADRMAGSVATARAMGARLKEKSQKAFEADVAKIRAIKEGAEGSADLKPWDVSYYIEKLKKQELDFDAEELRPYFDLDRVMTGCFKLAERLFSITIQAVESYQVLDESVRVYEITDQDGTYLGHFYADFIVRESKRAGAWMAPLSSIASAHSDAESSVGVICGNMTAPLDGKPALLTHAEVLTVFHEFGHLLHGMLYRGALACQSGMCVEWDFIELPSQLMENWCWTREGLDLFAEHFETGEKIPDALLEKLQASRNFLSSVQFQRQLGLAELDFSLHCDYAVEKEPDILAFARGVTNAFSVVPNATSAMINSFHHLMGEATGYACGYYSYRWAEVLEADVFEEATAKQMIDPEWGARYKREVFQGGSTLPAVKIYEQLMGRGPDEEALLRREGLI